MMRGLFNLQNCCQKVHDGEVVADTPEAALRARFSAYIRNRPEHGELLLTCRFTFVASVGSCRHVSCVQNSLSVFSSPLFLPPCLCQRYRCQWPARNSQKACKHFLVWFGECSLQTSGPLHDVFIMSPDIKPTSIAATWQIAHRHHESAELAATSCIHPNFECWGADVGSVTIRNADRSQSDQLSATDPTWCQFYVMIPVECVFFFLLYGVKAGPPVLPATAVLLRKIR